MNNPEVVANIRRIQLQAQLEQVSADYARARDAMDAIEEIAGRLMQLNADILGELRWTRRALALSMALSCAAFALAAWSLS